MSKHKVPYSILRGKATRGSRAVDQHIGSQVRFPQGPKRRRVICPPDHDGFLEAELIAHHHENFLPMLDFLKLMAEQPCRVAIATMRNSGRVAPSCGGCLTCRARAIYKQASVVRSTFEVRV